jgi:hypothetical protein
MTADKVYLALFWAAAMGLWSMTVWGHWAEWTYEKGRERAYMWFWLRLLGIPQTKENCIRFLKGTSLAGMVLLTLMTGAEIGAVQQQDAADEVRAFTMAALAADLGVSRTSG